MRITKRTQLAAKLNLEETARREVDLRKEQMLLRINQFNDLVRADLGGTKWEKALANIPSIGDGAGNFTPPLDDASTLWLQMNADTEVGGPLLLLGGYSQADFAADLTSLKAAFTIWRAAGVVANVTLLERNQLQDIIEPILVNYRKKLPTKFPKGHPIVDSLSAVNPAPGSTPDGVTINGVWDVTTQMAKLTFDASTSSDVAKYELRFCAGPNDNTDVETVVTNLPPDAPPRVLHHHRQHRLVQGLRHHHHRQRKRKQCRQRDPPVVGQPQSRLLGGPSWNSLDRRQG